jgi:N-acetyl-beta-hexosaminidase
VPVFQTLGHFENILNLPDFIQYAEYPGAASLNVTNPASDEFLFNMLEEVVPLFQSPYFNIGADESWDVGLGANRDLVARDGIAALHASHYKKVFQKVKALGKKPLMYSDMLLNHPEILSLIPKEVVLVDWHYNLNDNFPSVKQLTDSVSV